MTDTYSVSSDTAPIPLVPQSLVRAECVRFMWAQALRSIAMLPPVVALMLWIESPYIPTTRLVAWASIMTAAVGTSLVAALAYRIGPSSDSPRSRRWLYLRSLTGAIQGTGWGLSAVLIMPSHLHRDMRVVLMTFLVGITTSMVIAYAGSGVAYLCATLPVWIPTIVVFFTSGRQFDVALGVGGLFFVGVMFLYNHEIRVRIVGNIRLSLERAALNEHLVEANAAIHELANRDDLTGAHNRRHLMVELDREMARSDRDGTELWFALFDIDHFKSLNDMHGHLAGDTFLRALVARAASELRIGDCLARHGGEEFAIVLPAVDRAGALECIERIRLAIETMDVWSDGAALRSTASFGLAAHEKGSGVDRLMRAADVALYSAKDAGRNRVVVSAPVVNGLGAGV